MSMMYLALGDSLTTGYGVGINHSFATIYYTSLLSNIPGLRYVNLGVNGLTSGALANMVQLRSYPLIAQSKVISITISSNDLLAVGKGLISGTEANIDLTLGNLNDNLLQIGNNIRTANPSALIKIATIYTPLPLIMNKQSVALTQSLVNRANHSIIRMAREFRFAVVPVAKAFCGREQLLLGSDHLHPNLMGHRVIADLFSNN